MRHFVYVEEEALDGDRVRRVLVLFAATISPHGERAAGDERHAGGSGRGNRRTGIRRCDGGVGGRCVQNI
jgi:hypothetical protein